MSLELVSGAPVIGGALGIAAIGVWLSARRDFMLRLLSFAAASPMLLLAASTGRIGATALAAGIAVVCCWEYARMLRLDRITQSMVTICAVAVIALTLVHVTPPLAGLVLASSALPLLFGQGRRGLPNAAAVAFGVLWLGGALSQLPAIGTLLLPVAVAVSIGDVAAYFGGSIATKHAATRPWLATRLSPLSPNKTWAGALLGAGAAVATLAVFGAITVPTVLAVSVGAVAGDLLESMVKRACEVKDAGTWLPGFGGLLDRVDSLLGALLIIGLFA